jgi:hypothetical protein
MQPASAAAQARAHSMPGLTVSHVLELHGELKHSGAGQITRTRGDAAPARNDDRQPLAGSKTEGANITAPPLIAQILLIKWQLSVALQVRLLLKLGAYAP